MDVVAPWTTTVINPAYQTLLDSFNVDVTVAAARVLTGTVSTMVPANGRTSVPVTLIVEAAAGAPSAPRSGPSGWTFKWPT